MTDTAVPGPAAHPPQTQPDSAAVSSVETKPSKTGRILQLLSKYSLVLALLMGAYLLFRAFADPSFATPVTLFLISSAALIALADRPFLKQRFERHHFSIEHTVRNLFVLGWLTALVGLYCLIVSNSTFEPNLTLATVLVFLVIGAYRFVSKEVYPVIFAGLLGLWAYTQLVDLELPVPFGWLNAFGPKIQLILICLGLALMFRTAYVVRSKLGRRELILLGLVLGLGFIQVTFSTLDINVSGEVESLRKATGDSLPADVTDQQGIIDPHDEDGPDQWVQLGRLLILAYGWFYLMQGWSQLKEGRREPDEANDDGDARLAALFEYEQWNPDTHRVLKKDGSGLMKGAKQVITDMSGQDLSGEDETRLVQQYRGYRRERILLQLHMENATDTVLGKNGQFLKRRLDAIFPPQGMEFVVDTAGITPQDLAQPIET